MSGSPGSVAAALKQRILVHAHHIAPTLTRRATGAGSLLEEPALFAVAAQRLHRLQSYYRRLGMHDVVHDAAAARAGLHGIHKGIDIDRAVACIGRHNDGIILRDNRMLRHAVDRAVLGRRTRWNACCINLELHLGSPDAVVGAGCGTQMVPGGALACMGHRLDVNALLVIVIAAKVCGCAVVEQHDL